MLVDVNDRDELERWIRAQPPDISVALAARSALRALPLLWTAQEEGFDGEIGADIILPVLRATAVA